MNGNDQITLFGETNFRNKYRRFGIKADDRRRHMYLIGKTGMGKSTVLENMIIEDIRAGRGVAVVDPHGDLSEKVIEYIPAGRINDTIYFNPADLEYPIAFNIVEHVEPHLRHIVASGLMGVFKKLWADSWGPRLEYILRNTILAVLDYPGATLLAVTRMLSDKAFRKKVVEKIQDPVVKAFWVNEFASYADKFAVEAVSPIQNKVGQFLSTSLIRNIVGQVKSSIDLREVMDEQKVLIMNLSKGRIGEDNSQLLGAMMITKIQLAAMSRVNISEQERIDFYLYVDEFQNFATESFANILSEARKYRLNLIMAHQYIEQLDEKVKAAVFGNVGTISAFRVGATDAEELVKEYTPTFNEEDLVNIPKYEMYVRLMIDGIMSEPFSARGLPPLTEEEKTGNLDKVIKVSRERYSKPKASVEEKILRWHMGDEEAPVEKPKINRNNVKNNFVPRDARKSRNSERSDFSPKPDRKNEARGEQQPAEEYHQPFKQAFQGFLAKDDVKSDREEGMERKVRENKNATYTNSAVCTRCGEMTNVSFVPDGVRPIFCKDCLSVIKEEKRLEVEARRKAKEEELKKVDTQIFPSQQNTGPKTGRRAENMPKKKPAKLRPAGVTERTEGPDDTLADYAQENPQKTKQQPNFLDQLSRGEEKQEHELNEGQSIYI